MGGSEGMGDQSTNENEQCINCGDVIEGEPIYGQGGIRDDGRERLAEGETVSASELFAFDDGPYCSLGCSMEADTQ